MVAFREWETATTDPEVVWPEPLTLPQRLQRSLRFWSAILPVILRYLLLEAQYNALGAETLFPLAEREAAWNDLHELGSTVVSTTIGQLRGFYSKSAQLIGSRPDLFPPAYCEKLAPFQDSAPPMDGALLIRVIESELGKPLTEMFSSFDAEPLGSASVAQVHRAVLRSTGKTVAVKVQRPAMEPLMLGDIANLLALSKQFRGAVAVDYYVVFSELSTQLRNEFNFQHEAESMVRIADLMDAAPGGPPIRVPRPVAGLVSKRCMVMDFIDGVPLSRLSDEMQRRGVTAGSPAAKAVGRKLLRALTDAYGIMLLQEGFIHGDPHPGNIMLCSDGAVALIDFGQTKALDDTLRRQLSNIMLLLDQCGQDTENGCPAQLDPLAEAALELGVSFKPECTDVVNVAAALAMWLFDSTVARTLPGGYDSNELSANSPVARVASFPQSLVFVGRSTVLIRGLANRLKVPWSLAREWAPAARLALATPEERAAAKAALDAANMKASRERRAAAMVERLFRWAAALLAALTGLWARLRFGAPRRAGGKHAE